jgi:hypothetical protein
MVRFWLIGLAAGSAAFVCSGCSGQKLPGAWFGAFPLKDASDCRIRLYEGESFDMNCRKATYLGLGRYVVKGNEIMFTFTKLRLADIPQKLSTHTLKFKGEGNRLQIEGVGTWQRGEARTMLPGF